MKRVPASCLIPAVAAVAAAAPMPVLAQQAAHPRFAFADVDFQADCRPNAAFERLLSVLHGRARPVGQEGRTIDVPLYNAVSGDTFHRLILDEPVDWHGLRLKGVDLYLGIERGPANHTLVFDESPSKVREVWNARGWNLPPVGERREIAGSGGRATIMLDGVEGRGAAVTCFRD